MITDRIGVAIIAFNRTTCLQQLLSSLEAQTHLGNVDFHMFQDGEVNKFSGVRYAEPAEIARSIGLFEGARLPNKELHVRTENVGTGINQVEALDYVTGHYEYAVNLEDDVVLSPHWLRLVRVLLGQVKDRRDIFSFTLGFKRCCAKDEVVWNLDKTRYGTPHWWGEALVSERWADVRPHFEEYYDLIRNVDYRYRPHTAIGELYRRRGWPQRATSQDGAEDMAVFCAGMKRLETVVNRGVSTGRQGVHFNSAIFEQMGLHEQEPYVFESDATLEQFVIPELEGK